MVLALGFVLCWSSGFIGAKLGVGQAPVLTLLMWRFVPLALVLTVVASVVFTPRWREWGPRGLGREVVIGLLSQSGYLLTVYAAIQLGVSTGTTALVDGTQPLVAGALAGPLLRQCVSARQWLGLALGLVGVLTVTFADSAANIGVAGWAYAVPFLGMLCLVAATFLERRTRTAVPPLLSLTVHCLSSAVVFTLLAVAVGVAAPPSGADFWLAVGWLVVFSTVGGYGLYWVLLRRSGVTRVNTLMFLMAPVTAVWGAVMFAEPLGWCSVLGLVLALAAVVVVHGAPGRPPSRTQDVG